MSACISVKQLNNAIVNLIKEINLYDDDITSELPNSWEKYGDLVLFQNHCFSRPLWQSTGETLWELICSMLKCKRIGIKGRIINDDFRSPKVSLVYGIPGDVYFKDNGIIYSWDFERSMFCRGNASERHRIGKLNCENEIIVDLFAGIGYFTLPYLVKANAKFVHACDWNPHAIRALRRNLEINKVSEKCQIYEGDNRELAPKGIGSRINVGLIPDSEGFWKTACESLIPSGGILYIHQNVTSDVPNRNKSNTCLQCQVLLEQLKIFNSNKCFTVIQSPPSVYAEDNASINWKKIEWFKFSLHISHVLIGHLENIYCTKWKVTVREYYKVKSYAPHIDHIVYSAYCYPV